MPTTVEPSPEILWVLLLSWLPSSRSPRPTMPPAAVHMKASLLLLPTTTEPSADVAFALLVVPVLLPLSRNPR